MRIEIAADVIGIAIVPSWMPTANLREVVRMAPHKEDRVVGLAKYNATALRPPLEVLAKEKTSPVEDLDRLDVGDLQQIPRILPTCVTDLDRLVAITTGIIRPWTNPFLLLIEYPYRRFPRRPKKLG